MQDLHTTNPAQDRSYPAVVMISCAGSVHCRSGSGSMCYHTYIMQITPLLPLAKRAMYRSHRSGTLSALPGRSRSSSGNTSSRSSVRGVGRFCIEILGGNICIEPDPKPSKQKSPPRPFPTHSSCEPRTLLRPQLRPLPQERPGLKRPRSPLKFRRNGNPQQLWARQLEHLVGPAA